LAKRSENRKAAAAPQVGAELQPVDERRHSHLADESIAAHSDFAVVTRLESKTNYNTDLGWMVNHLMGQAHDGEFDRQGLIERTNRFANGLHAAGLEREARVEYMRRNVRAGLFFHEPVGKMIEQICSHM